MTLGKEIIEEMKEYTTELSAMKEALEDGEYCGTLIESGYDQDDIEDAHNLICEQINN